jgi:hypothetical protein
VYTKNVVTRGFCFLYMLEPGFALLAAHPCLSGGEICSCGGYSTQTPTLESHAKPWRY